MFQTMLGRCLITGGTGFVGQNLIESLIQYGCPVQLISRKNNPNANTIVCDFINDQIPEGSLDSIDSLFHLAGFAHDLRDAFEIEHLYRKLNVEATLRLAEMAVDSGVKRFVFVSSVKAGGYDEESGSPRGVWSN